MKRIIQVLVLLSLIVLYPKPSNAALMPPVKAQNALGSFADAAVVKRAPIKTKTTKRRLTRVPASRFYWGQCVYGVASWVPVFWMGSAYQWPANARKLGFKTGKTPIKGSVMVSNESWYGHVALVVSVNKAKKTYKIKEMNYRGVGIVSYRTLPFSFKMLNTFIYLD